ncbi:MAG: selenium cofactor biosynthesis protein YqeC, partial [Thermodesulfobacteriota bacterium]|nr:selenium cofactor biosynthesis protein YqeC [Thermodesulfobacteriota bacterium]
ETLDIDLNENDLICFVGAGGKTTALFRLAKELKECEKRVLVTTTTAIYSPDESHCDEVILGRAEDSDIMTERIDPCICTLGAEITAEKKLLGVEQHYITQLFTKKIVDYILVEGDGSRQRSVKAPADHEPMIPEGTTKAVGVVGLDVLGTKIGSSSVHRPEQFCRLTDKAIGDIIDGGAITKLVLKPEGLFKTVPELVRKYVLFNKADNSNREKAAKGVVDEIKQEVSNSLNFIIADMLNGKIKKVQ